ncbi:membrane-bound alkaline phosphatase [Teleopsis dalmanni]|uniref:membrane-bound alkaline phosphatase n=1 Tax=Teleopsis dalmanni TaxID=139649 RepID=UPI0018CFD5B7|nr:membrane-bound alkaline phosphatase [Teleopsis dalmanni]
MRAVLSLCLTLFIKIALCSHYEDDYNVDSAKQLKSPKFWIADGQRTLYERLRTYKNENVAKNIIFFLGDGMGVATVTASRIFEAQIRGKVGERNELSFERFPHLALSKTYCTDQQVADSACSATAYLTGVKANYNTIGVTANVTLNDCAAARDPINQLSSIARWAAESGKATGIVTTTRVTHASPAGTYAYTSNRDFESDADVKKKNLDPAKCEDIASQLVGYGSMNVILGGGSSKFLPTCAKDGMGNSGERLDGRNLIAEWAMRKYGNAKVVYNRTDLLNTNTQYTDNLLGLFSKSHLDYHLDNNKNEPSLEEMTETAINILRRNKNGFFLFVEGGKIDLAHHLTMAAKALDETVEFHKAIKKAETLLYSDDTLIIVTADHSHTMTISGDSKIDNGILAPATQNSDVDKQPYTSLSYANGPVASDFTEVKGNKVQRVDITKLKNFGKANFQYPHCVPLSEESHSGTDVAIYAKGPWSHLFSGVMEQSAIPILMAYAACIGPGIHACSSSASSYASYE